MPSHRCGRGVHRWCEPELADRKRGVAESAAASVWLAAVVRLGTASPEFASFCLCHSTTRVPSTLMYRRVRLSGGSWSMVDVRILVTPLERLRGIHGADGSPVLLLARSIHTLTLSDPISVAVLSLDGMVVLSTVMQPRRVLSATARHWFLEAVLDTELPRSGMQVAASTMPNDGRNTRPLRDTHREPRRSL